MVAGRLGFSNTDTSRPMSSVIPAGVNFLEDSVKEFNPAKNQVVLASGKTVSYDYMVVSTGLKMDWEKIPGLREAIDDPNSPVASSYDYNTAEKAKRIMEEFTGGEALFTQPACPIKCGGGPQKVMWLNETHFRTRGIRDKTNVRFHTNLPSMFHVKKYGDALDIIAAEKNIDVSYRTDLVKVDKDKRIATFKHLDTNQVTTKPYDVLHVVPYMSPPEVIKKSPLANKDGFVDVDKYTLQSTKFPNVFALGDSSNLPTSKTAAAIASEAPVLVSNLIHTMKGENLTAKFDGYTACPIFTGDGKLMLCEFGYDLVVNETFPWDQSKPGYLAYYMKKDVFPPVYWNAFVKGIWYGKDTFFRPSSAQ